MNRKIIGVTVGTSISPEALKKKMGIDQGSGGNVDLTGYATEEFVEKKLAEHASKGPAIEIFPETYFETERGDGFNWNNGENSLFFNLNYPIKEGTTYLVTVNGVVHSVTAVTEDWGEDSCAFLRVPDAFTIYYAESGFIDFKGYNVAYQPKEWIEDDDGLGAFTPVTIGIKQEVAYATEKWVEEKLEKHSGGNFDFKTDETLTLKDGILSVNTTNDMEQDNTLPITSAGVYATVGNIEALLKTI